MPPKQTRPDESIEPWWMQELLASQESANRIAELNLERERLKHRRKEMVWRGFGYTLVGTGVIGTFLGVIFMWTDWAKNEDKQDTEQERLRTAQVQSCTSIEEPLERQYCLLGLNISVEQPDD